MFLDLTLPNPKKYSSDDQETWQTIVGAHQKVRQNQVHELFIKGVQTLCIRDSEIPDLQEINQTLNGLTGFQGVWVDGLENGNSFYRLLSDRKFPIGNFIRDKKDLGYTPAPDIVHDLYGHLPFLTDPDYADFCQKIGTLASRFIDRPDKLRQFERFFWFTIEFGLIETNNGRRVFGAGIASSISECTYALSNAPEVIAFDVDLILNQEFRIDIMQPKLFCLKHVNQLYESLASLERRSYYD